MNPGRILFVAIFFLSATTLLTATSALEAVKDSFLPLSLQQDLHLQNKRQKLQEDYKQNLAGLLEAYGSDKAPLNEQEIGQLENQLLALSVPPDFKNLHFKLIASLENFRADDYGKKQLRAQLQELISQYSWLASSFSLFIMNNF